MALNYTLEETARALERDYERWHSAPVDDFMIMPSTMENILVLAQSPEKAIETLLYFAGTDVKPSNDVWLPGPAGIMNKDSFLSMEKSKLFNMESSYGKYIAEFDKGDEGSFIGLLGDWFIKEDVGGEIRGYEPVFSPKTRKAVSEIPQRGNEALKEALEYHTKRNHRVTTEQLPERPRKSLRTRWIIAHPADWSLMESILPKPYVLISEEPQPDPVWEALIGK